MPHSAQRRKPILDGVSLLASLHLDRPRTTVSCLSASVGRMLVLRRGPRRLYFSKAQVESLLLRWRWRCLLLVAAVAAPAVEQEQQQEEEEGEDATMSTLNSVEFPVLGACPCLPFELSFRVHWLAAGSVSQKLTWFTLGARSDSKRTNAWHHYLVLNNPCVEQSHPQSTGQPASSFVVSAGNLQVFSRGRHLNLDCRTMSRPRGP